MVVDVGLFLVVALFLVLAVVVAVSQRVVVMGVAMPEGPMVPLGQRSTSMVVRDMVVVVTVGRGGMGMLGLLAFTFGPLDSHRTLLRSCALACRPYRAFGYPLELLLQNGEYFKTVQINYHDGNRFPHLVRQANQPDLLSEIIKQHAAAVAGEAQPK